MKNLRYYLIEVGIFLASLLVPAAFALIMIAFSESHALLTNSPLYKGAAVMTWVFTYIMVTKRGHLKNRDYRWLLVLTCLSWSFLAFIGFGFTVKSLQMLIALTGVTFVVSMIAILLIINPELLRTPYLLSPTGKNGFWDWPEAGVVTLLALAMVPAAATYYLIIPSTTAMSIVYAATGITWVIVYLIWYVTRRKR